MAISLPDLVRRLHRRAVAVRLCAALELRLGKPLEAAELEGIAALFEEAAGAIESLRQGHVLPALFGRVAGADRPGGGGEPS